LADKPWKYIPTDIKQTDDGEGNLNTCSSDESAIEVDHKSKFKLLLKKQRKLNKYIIPDKNY
jgi:hypothetical protein